MRLKRFAFSLVFSIIVTPFLFNCGESSLSGDDNSGEEDLDLVEFLTTPGNVAELPANEATGGSVTGLVVDNDDDEDGDGLDLSGDGSPNIIYGTLSLKSGVDRASVTLPFYVVPDGTQQYFFYVVNNEIRIAIDEAATQDAVFVTSGGVYQGIDLNGDGVIDENDDQSLEGISVYSFNNTYSGTCEYQETNGSNTYHTCLEFIGAGFTQDAAETFCTGNYGADNVTFTVDPDNRCPSSNAIGYCQVLRHPTEGSGLNAVFTHNVYTYNDDMNSGSAQSSCESEDFTWVAQ